MNILNKVKILIINLAAMAPFLNQTLSIKYDINIYIIISIIALLIIPLVKNYKLIINKKDLILIILFDLFC